MSSRRLLALPLLVALAAASPADARGLVVSPTQLGLVGKPGSSVAGTIVVGSSRAESNQVRVTLLDYSRDEDGRVVERALGGEPRSCKNWLEADRTEFTSPETGRVEMRITARIPANASGSYWALAALESLPPKPKLGMGMAIQMVPRVVVPIVVTVSGTERRLVKIGGVSAKKVDGGVDAVCEIENTGNTAVLVSGAFTLERATGSGPAEEVAEAPVTAVTSLPGLKLRIKKTLAFPLPNSAYTVRAILRYGPDPADVTESAATIEGEAPPPAGDRLAPPAPTHSPGGGS
jgi:hypothetical protein